MANETRAEKKKRLKAEAKEAARQAKIDAGENPDEVEEDEDGEVYTYVGKGDSVPKKINFMGKQVFKRGEATVVTNPDVLNKIRFNPCFVEGTVDEEDLEVQDDEAEEAVKKQQAIDARIDASFKKKHSGE